MSPDEPTLPTGPGDAAEPTPTPPTTAGDDLPATATDQLPLAPSPPGTPVEYVGPAAEQDVPASAFSPGARRPRAIPPASAPPPPPPPAPAIEYVGPAAEQPLPASAIPPGATPPSAAPPAPTQPAAQSSAPAVRPIEVRPPAPVAPPAGLVTVRPTDDHAAPTLLRQPLHIPINPHIVVLTAIVTLMFLAFVLIEPTPRWMLIFTAIVAVVGVDGTLRTTWRASFSGPAATDSSPYLFLPALFVLATPLLIEHNARGYAVIPAAIVGGLAFGAVVIGEVLSVQERAREYPAARLLVAAGAYVVAFTLFALPYVLEVSLRASVGAVALVSVMLALELLREGQVDSLETIVYAFVTGLTMGELRWAVHYLPVDGYLAGLALVLGFFLLTGVIGSYLTRRLDAILAVEYAIVGALGIALVIFARASGAA